MGDEPTREGLSAPPEAAPDPVPWGLGLCDRSPIACCTFDRHAVILEVNPSGARLLGKLRSQIVGGSFLALVGLGDTDAFLRHLRESIEGRIPVLGETTLSIGRDSIEVQLVSVAVPSPHGALTACHTAFLIGISSGS